MFSLLRQLYEALETLVNPNRQDESDGAEDCKVVGSIPVATLLGKILWLNSRAIYGDFNIIPVKNNI